MDKGVRQSSRKSVNNLGGNFSDVQTKQLFTRITK